MRKVEFCKKGYMKGENNNAPSDFEQGTLHGFFSEGSHDEGIECYGLIELSDGSLRMEQIHKMRFILEPPKSELVESPDKKQQTQPKMPSLNKYLKWALEPESGMRTHDEIYNYFARHFGHA